MNLNDYIPQSVHGWQITLYFFLALSTVLVISEIASRLFKLPKEFSRKFIHISVGLLVVAFSFSLSTPQPLLFLCLIFSIVNFFVKRYNLVPSMSSERETYGTVYYPLAILVAIILFWDNYRFIFVNVVLIMALADAFAAVVGQAVKNPLKYKVWDDWKSLQGSVTFFLITYLLIITSYWLMGPQENTNINFSIYIIAFLISLIAMMAESISSKGSDNFSITLVAGFFCYIFLYADIFYQVQFIEAIVFSIIAASISLRVHFLHIDGAISMALMAIFIYGIGEWQWTIPVLTFFITSSVLSKIGRKRKYRFRLLFEKSSKRDSKQVFANGGVALIIVNIFYFTQNELFFYLYLTSLAAANADTWATEIGVFNKSKPRLITTFKKVEKGSSGAVSMFGSSAALLGSLVVALSGLLFIDTMSFTLVLLLTLCGFLANFADSFLGATLQAQYTTGNPPMVTEKAFTENGYPNSLIRGYRWLNNDFVNLISILTAPFLYLTSIYFF